MSQINEQNKAATVNADLQKYLNAANNTPEEQRIVFIGDKQLGHKTSYFTFKSTKHESIEKFREAIKKEYGAKAADAASPLLDQLQAGRHTLHSSHINQAVEFAKNEFHRMNSKNAEEGGAYYANTLNRLMNNSEASQAKQALFDKLSQAFSKASPEMKERFTMEAYGKFMSAVAEQSISASIVSGAEVQDLSKLIQGNLSKLDAIVRDVCEDNQLVPYTGGLKKNEWISEGIKGNAVIDGGHDVIMRIPKKDNADMTQILTQFTSKPSASEAAQNLKVNGEIGLALILEKLNYMRQIQSNGPLSAETIWSVCTENETPLPENVKQDSEKLLDELENFLRKKIRDYFGQKYKANGKEKSDMAVDIKYASAYCALTVGGLTFEKAIERTLKPGKIVFEDIVGSVTLYAKSALNPEKAMFQLATDLPRMGDNSFTFFVDNQKETVNIDKEVIKTNAPETKELASKLINNLSSLCGDNDLQKIALTFGMTQAGKGLVYGLKGVVGAGGGEHDALDISIKKVDGSDDVLISYKNKEGSEFGIDYSYLVHADGSSELIALTMDNLAKK